jgi:uncharacterized protein YdeI (YjbR/CyaY-like superfamily)
MPGEEIPALSLPSAAAWRRWLESEHAISRGVWLKIARKDGAEAGISYPEALLEALCFGWIDGQKRSLDTNHWLQRFSPRKPGGRWSKINTEHAEALIAAGRMQPAGQREVDAARADGRWDAAYAGQRTIQVPDDLAAALAGNPEAAAFFATITSQNRFAILFRIGAVKRPDTRARKIAQYVEMLAAHKTIY